MPSQSTDNTLLRYFELLRLLPTGGSGKTSAELRQALEDGGYTVSKRTVERDLQALAEIFPSAVDINPGTPQGWRKLPDHKLDLAGLSLTDALTLRLIEETLRPLLPASLLKTLAPRFEQARAQVAAQAASNKQASWARKVSSVPPTLPMLTPAIDEKVLEVVQECLLNDEQLEVTYRGWGPEEVKSLTLHPHALVQRGPVTYLVATAFAYEDLRIYAAHRIASAVRPYTAARKQKNFRLDKYLEEGHFGFGDHDARGEEITLELRVIPHLARVLGETPLAADQSLNPVKKEDGSGRNVRVTATVRNTRQLLWWLLSHGPDIEVVKPLALRKRVAAMHEEAAQTYKTP